MQKTYWWRVAFLTISVSGILLGYAVFYPFELGICNIQNNTCLLSGLKRSFAEPLFLFSLFSFSISLFLFFVSDRIFLKWLRFALIWAGISVFFIALAPEYSGGIISFGDPTKEIVSIWSGTLFVFLSLLKIAWERYRERRG